MCGSPNDRRKACGADLAAIVQSRPFGRWSVQPMAGGGGGAKRSLRRNGRGLARAPVAELLS